MLKKVLVFVFTILLFSNSFAAFAQENSAEKFAKVKFKLADFRNPSFLRGRFGLLLFSPDAKYLATGGTAREIKIYDAATGQIKSTLDGDRSGFNAFSFNPDGKTAIVQDTDYSELRVFDIETGKLLKKITGSEFLGANKKAGANSLKGLGGLEMSSAPVAADWKTVLIQKNEGEYEMVDIATNEVKHKFDHSKKSSILKDFFKMAFIPTASVLVPNANFSPDGKFVVIANGNNFPTLWNAETGNLVAKLEPQNDRVYRASFSPDSKLAITGNVDGINKVWETETGKMLSMFGSEKDKMYMVAWSVDNQKVVTISLKKDARVWDARSGKLLFAFEKSHALDVVFSPDGSLVATTHQDDKKIMAQIWNSETGELLATMPRQKEEDRAFSLVWSPNGKFLVTPSTKVVKIWNMKGELVQTLENAVFPARFSRDGKLLATGGKNDIGYVWQIEEE